MKRPVIVEQDGANLLVDGAVADPHSRAVRSLLGYFAGPVDHQAMEAMLAPGDTAYTGKDAIERSYTFRQRGGTFRIMPGSVWGLPNNPEAAQADLAHLQAAVEEEGWKWGATAGTIAGRILDYHTVVLGQLPPRWRALAHAAINQGPQVVTRGGAPFAWAIDRKAAFLSGMRAEVATGFVALPPEWRIVRRAPDGFVRASVRVPETDGIPPLPVYASGASWCPSGEFVGTWTIKALREAEALDGVSILRIYEAAGAMEMEPYHAPAADRIEEIADKRLRKPVYLRYWGRMAAVGGWQGRPDSEEHEAEEVKLIGSSLWWKWHGHGGESTSCPPDYRPDHAAMIATSNAMMMAEAARSLPGSRILGAHVDCLWVEGNAGDAPPRLRGEWSIKSEGPCRLYAPGVYVHGETMCASGCKSDIVTAEDVATFASKGGNHAKVARVWRDGVTCAESEEARSDAPTFYQADGKPDYERGIYNHTWTNRGWIHEERKHVESESCQES